MGLIGLQGIVSRLDPRAIGLPAERRRALFPSPATLHRTSRPPNLANRVHSLVSPLPFGVPASASWPLLSEPPSCRGFVPHRGITDGTHAREPSRVPLRLRPQAFSASRRFAPPSASRACCIPQPRPGLFTVQGFLPPHSRPGSSPGSAPVPLPPERSPASRLPPSSASTSRPCSVR